MISFSDKPRSKADWRAIDIGHAIHMEVVEEGRREGVWAYLFHDGKGQAWFEKCKPAVFKDGKLIERAGVPYRRFSPALVEKMRRHKDELRVYARWCENTPAPVVGSEKVVISNAGNGKGERTQLTNEK